MAEMLSTKYYMSTRNALRTDKQLSRNCKEDRISWHSSGPSINLHYNIRDNKELSVYKWLRNR